jgi:nicotinamidase-related amidase
VGGRCTARWTRSQEIFGLRKAWSDSFQGTGLNDLLRASSVTRVVLVGVQTEFCVDATARRALSLGYDVDLVADGHTTSENDHGNSRLMSSRFEMRGVAGSVGARRAT